MGYHTAKAATMITDWFKVGQLDCIDGLPAKEATLTHPDYQRGYSYEYHKQERATGQQIAAEQRIEK